MKKKVMRMKKRIEKIPKELKKFLNEGVSITDDFKLYPMLTGN